MVSALQRAVRADRARRVFRGALEKPSCQRSFREMIIQCGAKPGGFAPLLFVLMHAATTSRRRTAASNVKDYRGRIASRAALGRGAQAGRSRRGRGLGKPEPRRTSRPG